MRDVRDLSQVGDETAFRRFMSACAALTSKPVVYADLARAVDIDQKTAKAWLSLLVGSYLVKIVPAYYTNRLKRLSKRPVMHFTDTGLAAYLAGWRSAEQLETSPFAGAVFETETFSQIYRSYTNCGLDPALFFFRTNDKKEIDLLLEREGTLYPVEVKKTARPQSADLKHFAALDPVYDPTGHDVLGSRNVGMGTLVCMTRETYPLSDRAWAFPFWAI
jgi:predicted AAA+ superfamily ATPase